MAEWNKVKISDEAIRIAAETNNISQDDAFDRLLELLEIGEHAIFKGVENGIDKYRLENEYLFVKDQVLVSYSQRHNYSFRLRSELHYAEDGRCEKCGRPMDKQAVMVQRKDETVFNDFNNYVLVCPDCNQGKPDRLIKATFHESAIVAYQEARNISLEQAKEELDSSKNNFVLLLPKKKKDWVYWGPRIGQFRLIKNQLFAIVLDKAPEPCLERRPQARSRRWNAIANQEVAVAKENN